MFIIVLYVLFIAFLLFALIYFIIKRIEDKEKENFEDRDN
jgi:preprotein translocase subunit YajC